MPDEIKTQMKTPMTSFSKGGGGNNEAPPVAISGDNLEQRVADLEMRPRMPASGTGLDGDVIELDGVSPRWGAGGSAGLPNGTNQNDMLVWDTGTSKWIKYVGIVSILRWWDTSTSAWKEVEVPSDLGKVLQVNNVVGEGLTIDYLKWR